MGFLLLNPLQLTAQNHFLFKVCLISCAFISLALVGRCYLFKALITNIYRYFFLALGNWEKTFISFPPKGNSFNLKIIFEYVWLNFFLWLLFSVCFICLFIWRFLKSLWLIEGIVCRDMFYTHYVGCLQNFPLPQGVNMQLLFMPHLLPLPKYRQVQSTIETYHGKQQNRWQRSSLLFFLKVSLLKLFPA